MTTFELGLIKALKCGCPVCGYDEFAMLQHKPAWSRVDLDENGKLDYGPMDWIALRDNPGDTENVAVVCDNVECYFVIWDEEGWWTERGDEDDTITV